MRGVKTSHLGRVDRKVNHRAPNLIAQLSFQRTALFLVDRPALVGITVATAIGANRWPEINLNFARFELV